MACQILFATLLGVFLGEWKGTSRRTRSVLVAGFILLVLTSVITGYSGKLSQKSPSQEAIAAESSARN
jgi:L-rhamnose-H+ transport protein